MDNINTTLMYADPKNNNYKFYKILVTGSNLTIIYGRVGSVGVTSKKSFYSNDGANSEAKRVMKAKMKKGYVDSGIPADDSKGVVVEDDNLKEIAFKSAIAGDKNSKIVMNVMEALVQMNAHNIVETSGGKLSVSSTGVVTSALGVVTLASVEKAFDLLETLKNKKTTDTDYSTLLGDYLTLVPQKVPSRNWVDTFLTSPGAIAHQSKFLTEIKESLIFAMNQAEDKKEVVKGEVPVVEFAHKIRLLEDKAEFARVEKFVKDSANSHHRGAYGMKLKNVYVIENTEEADKEWEAKRELVGNVRELWHGTGPINILSILKKGLFVPKSNGGDGIHIAGRMYGDGIYLSDQSTKSLNYSRGSWTGHNYSGSVFMFLADVVMGSEFRPYQNSSVSRYEIPKAARNDKNKHGNSFNSIYVSGGRDGVMNNEMVVWEADQIKMKYLCEFE